MNIAMRRITQLHAGTRSALARLLLPPEPWSIGHQTESSYPYRFIRPPQVDQTIDRSSSVH